MKNLVAECALAESAFAESALAESAENGYLQQLII
jgi:hypothetical protein